MVSFVFTYVLGILLLLGGNQNHTDLLDALSTNLYWQIKNVTPSLAQLEKDAGPDAPPQNVDKLLTDLQSDDFQTRDKAKRDLQSMGPGITNQLRPAAQSKDPEVAAVAATLLKNFQEHAKERSIRRLMAIRTLGERKEKEALPLLNSLKDSKEVFVSEYASRAIASIEGKQYTPADQSEQLTHDVALLPAEAAIVAQTSGLNPETLSLASLVDKAVDSANGNNPMINAMGGPPEKKLDKKQVLLDASRQLIGLIDHVGNVRLDAVTIGYGNKKEDTNWAVIVVRGKYDSALLYSVIKPLFGPEREPDSVGGVLSSLAENFARNTGGIPMITRGDEFCLLFPSDDQLVIVITEKSTLYIRNTVCSAIKNGVPAGSTVRESKSLTELFKQVDTYAPAWAIGRLTEEMQKDDTLGAFSTFAVDSKKIKGGVRFTIKAQGSQPDKLKAAAEKVSQAIKQAQAAIQQEVQATPAMLPVAEFISTLKLATNEKQAQPATAVTLTGELKAGLVGAVMGEMGPMILEELQPRQQMGDVFRGQGVIDAPPIQEVPEPLPNAVQTQPK